MITSLRAARREIDNYIARWGRGPDILLLTGPEYVAVVKDLAAEWMSDHGGNLGNFPDIEDIDVGGPSQTVTNLGLLDGPFHLSAKDLILQYLEWTGYYNGTHIIIGPLQYPWPPSPTSPAPPPLGVPGNQSGKSTHTQGFILSKPHAAINWTSPDPGWPDPAGTGVINPTSEPACHCSSPSEHDISCAWLAWKRGKK